MTERITASFVKYRIRLALSFLIGDYSKFMQPLNMLKNYYGEKYAFEFAYLLHYQAWLIIPSLTGLVLFGYQIYRFDHFRELTPALDSEYNAIYGFLVAIWASLFIESWKRK